jgi:Zn-dependent membrane protease YugP
MSSQLAMSLMSTLEVVLWVVLALLFWKKKLRRRFPAMGSYLALRVTSTPVLLVFLLDGSLLGSKQTSAAVSFFLYWAVYITGAVLLYFVCVEVFRSALSSLPGLMRLGIVVFRWVVLASLIASFSSITFSYRAVLVIPDAAYRLMRSVSILEFCLLAFLCMSMRALRLSVRDLAFGIALGLGVISAGDFLLAATYRTSLTDPMQFLSESMLLAVLVLWVTLVALPEPARKPMLLAVNSTVYRWNEIASALGHTGTQVAVHQSVNSSLLTDVERVADRVLSKNLEDRKSEI